MKCVGHVTPWLADPALNDAAVGENDQSLAVAIEPTGGVNIGNIHESYGKQRNHVKLLSTGVECDSEQKLIELAERALPEGIMPNSTAPSCAGRQQRLSDAMRQN